MSDQEPKTVEELLEKILFWTKHNYEDLRKKIIDNLVSDEQKIVYENSDGERSMRELANMAGLQTHTVIGDWWKNWYELGLMNQTEKYSGGRYEKIITLGELGIYIPKIKEVK